MQYSISYPRRCRLIPLAVLPVAALFLTGVTCAQAQAVDTADAAAAVALVESTASVESAPVEEEPPAVEPAPAPEPAPQPVEAATEAVGIEETVGATTQVTHAADPSSTLALRSSAPKASADLGEVGRTTARIAQAGQETTEATAGVVASLGDRLPQPDRALPELARRVQRDAANAIGHTEHVLSGSLSRIDPREIEDLRPGTAAGNPLEGKGEALPLLAVALQQPPASAAPLRTLRAGSPHERAMALNGPLEPPVSRPGGIWPLSLGGPRTPGFFGVGAARLGDDHRFSTPAGDAYAGDTVRGSREPAPLDSPGPPDDLPQVGASPSGSTSFIPIAALLVLLALVAPAIDRRRRKTVACSPPIPFVCALERPG